MHSRHASNDSLVPSISLQALLGLQLIDLSLELLDLFLQSASNTFDFSIQNLILGLCLVQTTHDQEMIIELLLVGITQLITLAAQLIALGLDGLEGRVLHRHAWIDTP
jgi:membrane-associated PAP2 superfamily phosphatase